MSKIAQNAADFYSAAFFIYFGKKYDYYRFFVSKSFVIYAIANTFSYTFFVKLPKNSFLTLFEKKCLFFEEVCAIMYIG